MSHRFVETATVGLVASVTQAIALVPTGLFLLATCTALLWNNEARTGFDDMVRASVEAPADRAGGLDGELVTVTGVLGTSNPIGDPVFFAPADRAAVVRTVEMFAWQEVVSTETRKLWGGSREVDTITEYSLGWTSAPFPPNWMRHPDGHENPPLPFDTAQFVPERLSIGAWSLDPMESLVLDGRPVLPEDVAWTEAGQRLRYSEDGWYYLDGASSSAPTLGDVRVRFVVAEAGGTFTAAGLAAGDALRGNPWFEGVRIVPVIPGDRNNAIQTLGAISGLLTWIGRLAGALGILAGLAMLSAPLFAVLDIIPPLGLVARIVAAIAMIPVAIFWSGLVIGLSQILHSTGFLIIAGVLLFGVAMAWWDGRKTRTA